MIQKPAYYGIDAPKVVRNLFLFSFLALILAVLSFQIETPIWFWVCFIYTASIAFSLCATGCWMLYCSWVAKPRIISKMIDGLDLKGHETLLDVGCGRGLSLIEAAKRLPKGKACSIDIWASKDQSGNQMEETLANAEKEGVRNRIEIQTADMRSIPYPDDSFDVVISSLAIHNVHDEKERNKALSEMLRVLKPGGKISLFDIHQVKKYAEFINQTGIAEVVCSNPSYWYCPPFRIVKGKKNLN